MGDLGCMSRFAQLTKIKQTTGFLDERVDPQSDIVRVSSVPRRSFGLGGVVV
jgi:hypothetical protein